MSKENTHETQCTVSENTAIYMYNQQEPWRGCNRALKIKVTHTVQLRAMQNTKEKT